MPRATAARRSFRCPSAEDDPRGCAMRACRTLLSGLAVTVAASAVMAAPQTYQLEKTHVDLLFAINHAGFSQKHGSFRQLDATLVYDADRPEASRVTVTVKTDSLDTGFA